MHKEDFSVSLSQNSCFEKMLFCPNRLTHLPFYGIIILDTLMEFYIII